LTSLHTFCVSFHPAKVTYFFDYILSLFFTISRLFGWTKSG
jgi:hypothetical protein